MSIPAEIKARIKELNGKRLFHLPPLIRGMRAPRTMFVSAEVDGDVAPPWAENFDGYRLSEFRGTLDAFTQGEVVTVAEDPFKKPGDAYMARVAPVKDDIFDIRSIDPKPGIRCLGGFAGQDAFIALTWDYRENISGRTEWAEEIERCKAAWTDLFGAIPPLHGASLNDYLTNFIAV